MSQRKASKLVLIAHAVVTTGFWLNCVLLSVVAFSLIGSLANTDLAQTTLGWGAQFATMLLFAVILHLLRRITGSVRDANPFTALNVRRLRWLAVITITEPIQRFVGLMLADVTADPATAGPMAFAISPASIMFGLCVFVLAEVFAHGVRLREDAEATI